MPQSKENKGITLIEVILAVGLIGILGLIFSIIIGQGNKTVVTGSHTSVAVNYAYAGMELVKSIPCDGLPPAGNYTINGPIPPVIAQVVQTLPLGRNTNASRSLYIRDIDDPAGGSTKDYKEVTVTVTWSEGVVNHQQSLVSYLVKRKSPS